MSVCMYVCIYIYMYVYIYMYIRALMYCLWNGFSQIVNKEWFDVGLGCVKPNVECPNCFMLLLMLTLRASICLNGCKTVNWWCSTDLPVVESCWWHPELQIWKSNGNEWPSPKRIYESAWNGTSSAGRGYQNHLKKAYEGGCHGWVVLHNHSSHAHSHTHYIYIYTCIL